jgi:hypothetical protein
MRTAFRRPQISVSRVGSGRSRVQSSGRTARQWDSTSRGGLPCRRAAPFLVCDRASFVAIADSSQPQRNARARS